MASISTKPYLLRALYDWCIDCGDVPYLVVHVDEFTRVPLQYVDKETQQIVLNIGVTASKDLVIENDWIHFGARFDGVAHDVWIPVANVVGIFARDSQEGMGFALEAHQLGGEAKSSEPEVEEKPKPKPKLTLVK